MSGGLHVEALDAGYPGRPVLDGVSFVADAGAVTSIIGPNGAGKSTLIKCLAGLLTPTAGQIRLGGSDVTGLGGRERAARIAYVPQADATRFPMTVFDTVLTGRRPYVGWAPGPTDLEAVAGAIERVGIAPLAQRGMHELSGGERQLVGIARAVAQSTDVLLADEPTTYLDLEHQLRVMELLGGLADDGVTVVLTIHDLNHALAVSDRIVVLAHGAVTARGAPGIVDAALVEQVYGVASTVIDHQGTPVVIAQRPVR